MDTPEQKNAFCLELIRNSKSAEVIDWLQDDTRIKSLGLLEGAEESIAFIQEVFDADAVQVFAVEIDDTGDDFENTGKVQQIRSL